MLVVSALAAVAVAAALAATGSSTVVRISSSSGYNEYPMLAVDAAGDATAVWSVYTIVNDEAEFSVATASRTGPSGSWSAPQSLSSPNDADTLPTVALGPGGAGAIAWTQVSANDTTTTIEAVTRRSFAEPWSTPVTVDTLPGDAGVDQIQLALSDAGVVTAVWSDGDSPGSAIEVSSGDTVNDTWTTPGELAGRNRGGANPQLVVNGAGDAIVTWSHQLTPIGARQSGRPTRFAETAVFGTPDGIWTPPRTVASFSQIEGNPGAEVWTPLTPVAALDATGAATLGWTAQSGSHTILEVAHAAPGGQSWTKPQVLAANPGPWVIGADDAGATAVAWTTGRKGQVAVDTSPDGVTWAAPRMTDASGVFNTFMTVAPDGEAALTWLGPHSRIMVSERPNAADAFGTPVALGAGGYPQAAIDGTGQITVVWPKLDANDRFGSTIIAATRPSYAAGADAQRLTSRTSTTWSFTTRTTSARSRAISSGATSSATRRARARSFATAQLEATAVPVGAARASSDPSTGRILNDAPSRPAISNFVDVHRFWTIPGEPAAVLAWFKNHHPAGFSYGGSASYGNSHTGLSSQSLIFDYTHPPAGIYEAQLTVTVAAASAGTTALRIDSDAVPLTPRPGWERVPADIHAITVTVQSGGTHTYPVATVTAPAEVKRLVTLVNTAQIIQPGTVFGCPVMLADEPTFVLHFKASAGAPAAATARQTGCVGMSLTVGGRTGSLLDATFDLSSLLWQQHVLPVCSNVGASSQIERSTAPVEDTVELRVKDLGSTACGLQGYPTIGLLAANGSSLTTRQARIPHGKPVTPPVTVLDPVWDAGTAFSWPRPTARCSAHPTATAVRLALPGVTGTETVKVGSATRPVDPCGGKIAVAPIGASVP